MALAAAPPADPRNPYAIPVLSFCFQLVIESQAGAERAVRARRRYVPSPHADTFRRLDRMCAGNAAATSPPGDKQRLGTAGRLDGAGARPLTPAAPGVRGAVWLEQAPHQRGPVARPPVMQIGLHREFARAERVVDVADLRQIPEPGHVPLSRQDSGAHPPCRRRSRRYRPGRPAPAPGPARRARPTAAAPPPSASPCQRRPPPEARTSTQSMARTGSSRFNHQNATAGTVTG